MCIRDRFEIYRYHTLQPNNILNEQLHYRSHTLFDTLIQTHNLNPVSYTHLDVYKRQHTMYTITYYAIHHWNKILVSINVTRI